MRGIVPIRFVSLKEIISIITMGIIAGATIWYTVMTRRLWKVNEKLIEQNRKLWELSRDTALCNYAENYLASFVQRLRNTQIRCKDIKDHLDKIPPFTIITKY